MLFSILRHYCNCDVGGLIVEFFYKTPEALSIITRDHNVILLRHLTNFSRIKFSSQINFKYKFQFLTGKSENDSGTFNFSQSTSSPLNEQNEKTSHTEFRVNNSIAKVCFFIPMEIDVSPKRSGTFLQTFAKSCQSPLPETVTVDRAMATFCSFYEIMMVNLKSSSTLPLKILLKNHQED